MRSSSLAKKASSEIATDCVAGLLYLSWYHAFLLDSSGAAGRRQVISSMAVQQNYLIAATLVGRHTYVVFVEIERTA
jgi:hypothetical protein